MKRNPVHRKPASARLVIHQVHFDVERPWYQHSSLMAPLLACLEQHAGTGSIRVKEVCARKPVLVESWSEAGAEIRTKGSGYYELEVGDSAGAMAMTLNVTDLAFVLEAQAPLADDDASQVRQSFTNVLESAHDGYCRQALVGPVLSITLRNVHYVRPRPARDNPQWPAGAITLAACRRYFASQGAESIARYELLQTREVPRGLVRRNVGDLLLLETESSAPPKLAEQRTLLEKWIGDALKLPIDEDFNELGDRRLLVIDRERVPDLGFYDPVTQALYKSAPELAGDELDPDTLELLERVLATSQLPDGRPVSVRRIVFVRRPAAVRWASWVEHRGGTVAYLGEDGELWEPAKADEE